MNTKVPWLAQDALVKGGPNNLVKSIARLLGHLGFEDVRIVDGANDKGADLLAVRDGLEWVFQSKWSLRGSVAADGVNEVNEAFAYYKADKAVVVTNGQFTHAAKKRALELQQLGLDIALWNGATIEAIGTRMPDFVPRQRKLRDYQTVAADRIIADLEISGRGLLILATGLGKTVVGGEVIRRSILGGNVHRILVLSHLKELSAQLEMALWNVLPKDTATGLLTGETKLVSQDGVVAATIDSALAIVQDGYQPDLIMIDEAHHVGENGRYRKLLELLPETPYFGVTATPWRGDEFDLSSVFGESSYRMGIAQGMASGWLSEVDYRVFVDNIDWDQVRHESANSYSIGQLNAKLFLPQRDEEILDQLWQSWTNTREPRAIVFCRTIQHAEEIAELLRRSSPEWRNAVALHSDSSPQVRNKILNEFKLGRTPILTSVDILNEGVDIPDVNLIVFLRVTHSRRIFVQQLGRGLRLAPVKDKLLVLDFVSDLRRIAAALSLRREYEGEVERLRLETSHSSEVSFSDVTNGSLLDYWLKDAADVESSSDEVKLQFPPDMI